MTYLLDTNVVSAMRKPERNPEVRVWAESVPLAELFVAATTLAEIERGVVAKERGAAVAESAGEVVVTRKLGTFSHWACNAWTRGVGEPMGAVAAYCGCGKAPDRH